MVDRILADWPFKLLALGLAFALWVSITGEKRIPVNFDIALDPQLREEHILGQSPPTQVTVRLVGPESVIRKLNPLEMAVRLDLTEWPPGVRDVQLTEAYLVGKPARAEVEFFDPERVQLVVDERQQRQLEVTPDFTGDLPDGYTMYHSRVRPEKVLVEGPAAEVSTLTHIETDPVPLGGRTRPFIERVSAVPDKPHVRVVNPEPLEVQVDVDTSPVDRSFDDVPVLPSSRNFDTELTPAVASVTLAGPAALLERIGLQQIRILAEVGGLDPSSGATRVPLIALIDAPANQQLRLDVKAITPHRTTVRLSERSEAK